MPAPLDPARRALGALPPVATPADNRAGATGRTADGKTFADTMRDFVDQVDDTQKRFDQAIEAVERGETDNLHQVMIAQNHAQMSLRLASQVRDKLVQAYKEVMRTQI